MQTQQTQQSFTENLVQPAPKIWTGETIKEARKLIGLTQAELAAQLGCRQQTISEWEVGMYAPKNAYQKLLSQTFTAKDGVGAQDEPSFTATIPALLGTIQYMQKHGLTEIRIAHRQAQDTFKLFGGEGSGVHVEDLGQVHAV